MPFRAEPQPILIFAYNISTGEEATGIADSITAKISQINNSGFGPATATNDTNPTELDLNNLPGVYAFSGTAEEWDCERLLCVPISTGVNIKIEPVEYETRPRTYTDFTVNSGISSLNFLTNLTASDDTYNNEFALFLDGSLAGQAQKITDYAQSSGNITVGSAYTTTPSSGDRGIIIGKVAS